LPRLSATGICYPLSWKIQYLKKAHELPTLLYFPLLVLLVVFDFSNRRKKLNLHLEYINDGTYFREIEPMSINPESLTSFSIYEKLPFKENQYKFRILLTDPTTISKHKLLRLLMSWDKVYIHKSQLRIYNRYLKHNIAYILKHEEIGTTKKTDALVNICTNELEQAFKADFSSVEVVQKTLDSIQSVISQAVEFISDINSLKGLANLIGHDYQTHTHSIKVGWLMTTFINSNRDLFDIKKRSELKDLLIEAMVTGLLHDIGKAKIPKNIINKKEELNNQEYIIFQSHPTNSLSILIDTDISKSIIQAIHYHHENEDGSGYPSGIKGDRIPILAKICHIADVFDTMTSKRAHKKFKSPYEALKIMTTINPHLATLHEYEKEAKENKKPPITAVVRDNYERKLKRLREKEIIEEEAKKRVKTRLKLRDQGMSHCFNTDLLKRFITTINKSESFHLSDFID